MKMKFFSALAIAALAFASCSKDGADGPGGNNQGGKTPLGEEAWVTLNLNGIQTGGFGRALNNPNNTDDGTTDENKVITLRAIFFDDSYGVTKDMALAHGSATDPGGIPGLPGGSGATAGEAFKVPSSSTRMLIIANAPSSFPATFAEGANYTTVVNAVRTTATETVETLRGGASSANGFMMTNARGDLESTRLYATKAEAKADPVSLNLDRVLAKVRVIANSPSSTTPNVTVSGVQWILNVTNKKYFPVAKRTKTYLETTVRGCISPMDIYNPKLGSYRVDPNYTNNRGLYPTVGATAYNNEYSYWTQAQYTGNAITWNNPNIWEYCLENTQEELDNLQAYTTQALIKGVYAPSKFYVPGDGNPTINADPADNGDWMKIGNTFFSFASVRQWIQLELTNKFTHIENGNTSTFSTPITDGYNALVADVTGSAVDISYTKSGAGAADPAAVTAAVNTALGNFDTKKASIATLTAGKSVGTTSFYKGGVSFWQVMVKHDNDNSPTVVNKLGEFGVVRNSQYDIRITNFKSPGFPTVPEPDPEKKDEDNEAWLDIEINVNPWTWYTQDEEL